MTTRKRTTGRAPGSKRTATKRTTAKRATAGRATRRPGTRRTSSTAYRRRRARPKVATTVGAALGTLVVAFLLDASWPVRIGLAAVAMLLVGGYLFLQGRRASARTEDAEAPTTPAAPPAPTTETPEDPTA